MGYLDQPTMAAFDPELFQLLISIAKEKSSRRIKLLERSGVIPGGRYFGEYVPVDKNLRSYYLLVALDRLAGTDVIFLDPDNGLEVRSVPKGAADSPKFLYRD